MRQRHAPSVHVHLTYPEAWQTLTAVTVRRGTLDKLRDVCEQTGPFPVLDEAISHLDHARGALERAMGLAPERRGPTTGWSPEEVRSWTESELRVGDGNR
jgi:hypothetical protein